MNRRSFVNRFGLTILTLLGINQAGATTRFTDASSDSTKEPHALAKSQKALSDKPDDRVGAQALMLFMLGATQATQPTKEQHTFIYLIDDLLPENGPPKLKHFIDLGLPQSLLNNFTERLKEVRSPAEIAKLRDSFRTVSTAFKDVYSIYSTKPDCPRRDILEAYIRVANITR